MFDAAIVTVSDRVSRGECADESAPAMREILQAADFAIVAAHTVPDEREAIENLLKRLCDELRPTLVLTSGGTGFSPRDVTPEATLAVAEKLCPGIPEAMRFLTFASTRRAMLSRAVAGIRGRTLIVNLPGSPRAVRECLGAVLDELRHGLATLHGAEEARHD